MLAYFLKPGGTLLVVDLLKIDDPHASGHVHHVISDSAHYVVHKGGFREVDIRNTFEFAGLSSFVFDPKVLTAQHHGHDAHLFIAKGTKPLGVLPD